MTTILDAIRSVLEASSKRAVVLLIATLAIIGIGQMWPHHFPVYREEILTASKIVALISGTLVVVNLGLYLFNLVCSTSVSAWGKVVTKPRRAKRAVGSLLEISPSALAHLAIALSKSERTFTAKKDDPPIIQLRDLGIIEANDFYSGVFTITESAWRAMISMPEFKLPYNGALSYNHLSTLRPVEMAKHLPQKHPATIRYMQNLPDGTAWKKPPGYL